MYIAMYIMMSNFLLLLIFEVCCVVFFVLFVFVLCLVYPLFTISLDCSFILCGLMVSMVASSSMVDRILEPRCC